MGKYPYGRREEDVPGSSHHPRPADRNRMQDGVEGIRLFQIKEKQALEHSAIKAKCQFVILYINKYTAAFFKLTKQNLIG